MTGGKPDIPDDMIAKWQRVVNLMARIVDVPSSLVMKTDPPDHAVLVSSNAEDNPYRAGQSFELNSKLYCYSVLQDRDELLVCDAHSDPDWNDNQDLEHGMSFYIGHPLLWPDGTLFGTICVLDTRENEKAILYRDLLIEFRRVIEGDLALLVEVEERRRLELELQGTLGTLEDRVARRTRELEDANIALKVLLAQVETSRAELEKQVRRQIKGLVLPHVAKLKQTVACDTSAHSFVDLVESNLRQVTSSFAGHLADAFEGLTPTELEVAQLVMSGNSTKEIARILSRETSTIDFHRNNIRRKLGIDSRATNLRSHLMSLQ